jgi:hypothetical protein
MVHTHFHSGRSARSRTTLIVSLVCCLASFYFVDDSLLECLVGLDDPVPSQHHEFESPDPNLCLSEALPVERDDWRIESVLRALTAALPVALSTGLLDDNSFVPPALAPSWPLAKRNGVGVPLRC